MKKSQLEKIQDLVNANIPDQDIRNEIYNLLMEILELFKDKVNKIDKLERENKQLEISYMRMQERNNGLHRALCAALNFDEE